MTSWALLTFLTTASALVLRQPAATTANSALTCTPTLGSPTNGIASAYCACGNGFTQPLAPSTDPHTYDPCPATQVTVAPITITQNPWAFTTVQSGVTIECQSASYIGIDGTDYPHCAGKTQTIQPSKTPSLSIDIANATSTYAGSLSGTVMSTAVTNALSKVCTTGSGAAPKPTCTGTAVIGDLYYPDNGPESTHGEAKGELELIISQADFTDATMMDNMIKAMGAAFMQWTSHPSACSNLTFDVPEGKGGVFPQKRQECYAPGAIIAQYFSGQNVYGADDIFWIETKFQGAAGSRDVSSELCQEAMTAVSFIETLLTFFFPETALADAGINDAVDIACDLSEKFNSVTAAVASATAAVGDAIGH